MRKIKALMAIHMWCSLLIIFFTGIFSGYGQDSGPCVKEIHSRILNAETNEPIPFATVVVKKTKQATVADKNGNFLLDKLCGTEFTLECSCIGYKPIQHHHDVHHGDLVIYLAPDEVELQSVVLEAKTTVGNIESIAVDKIEKEQLITKSTRSLASAIGDIQGVSFTSIGANVQQPVIHGLNGNRISIINNGVKHGFQNWGTDHAPEIDIASADRISVLKGAAGVKYGPEALGGAVVVEGNPLHLSEKLYGNLSTGYQTNGRGYHTNINLGKGFETFSYHLGANYIRKGDQHAPDYSLTNTGVEEKSANVGFRYHLPQWDFKLLYNYVSQDLGLLRSSVAESGDLFARSLEADEPLIIRDFSYKINEPNQNTDHHLAISTINWYSDLGKISLLLSRQINLREEFDVRRNADLPIIDLELRTSDVRLDWAHTPIGGFKGSLGLEYFYQNNDNNPGTGTTPFIPNYNTQRFSAFVIESIKKKEYIYEFGLRIDHEFNSVRGREMDQSIFSNEYSFSNVTASLGLVHEVSPFWQWRTNIGSAWRTPNIAELYSFGQQGFKTQFGLWRYRTDENGVLNTDNVLTEEDAVTEPEKGYKWISELSYQKNADALTITAYSHFINNYIFDRPVAVIGTFRGPTPVFIYDQADALFIGTDVTYTHTFVKKLKLTLGASYLWSQNVRENESLINQPPLNSNIEFSWQTPLFWGIDFSKLSVEASYTFRQFQGPRTVTPAQLIGGEVAITPESTIFDFRDAPDGYGLGNIRWEWKLGSFGGQIEIQNILNTSYRDYLNQLRYFADEPGRNVLININYKF